MVRYNVISQKPDLQRHPIHLSWTSSPANFSPHNLVILLNMGSSGFVFPLIRLFWDWYIHCYHNWQEDVAASEQRESYEKSNEGFTGG